MFAQSALLAGTLLMISSAATAETLTIERIFDSPNLSGPSVMRPKISPDGERVTFLKGRDDDREQLDLWEYHIAEQRERMLVDSTKLVPDEGELSEEEKARRERQRIAGLKGIVSYDWAPDGKALLFPLGGDLYHVALTVPQKVTRLTQTDAFETDPQISPTGKFVSFVREQNLFVVEIDTGQERQLTADGGGVIKNAMAEFVAQEEMGRNTGYWWSPDDAKIAYLRVDETPVAITKRYEIDADDFRVIDQRYPYTGTANVTLKLGVLDLASGDTRWIDLGDNPDIYIPRVKWMPDSRHLTFQRQSRDQQTLELIRFDTIESQHKTLLTETAETWVNLHFDLTFLTEQPAFIWSSERSGFRHLYLYSNDGELIRPLTGGDWLVDSLEGVSEAAGLVYFSGWKDSPLERQLYAQQLTATDPAAVRQISRRSGMHNITMQQEGKAYLDDFSSNGQPPQLSLHDANGQRLRWLNENKLDSNHPYAPFLSAHQDTEFGELQAEDGQPLYYRMIKPAGFEAGKRYPVFHYVYGGPHVQNVNNSWSRRLLVEQYMAQNGFIVFVIDNRGSDRRGTGFENPIYRAMGTVEVTDQLVGVNFLKSLPYVDADRIGLFGWSYGGYMTLMSLAKHPNVWALGVSGAPVTEWELYDTHYTERYMSTPQDNPQGYKVGSVLEYAEQIDDDLLVIHGMADDNVLFTHSTKLYATLQQAGILFDSMNYPGAKHGVSGQKNQTHVWRTITTFFQQHLGEAD